MLLSPWLEALLVPSAPSTLSPRGRSVVPTVPCVGILRLRAHLARQRLCVEVAPQGRMPWAWILGQGDYLSELPRLRPQVGVGGQLLGLHPGSGWAQGGLLQGMWPQVQGLRAYALVFLMEVRALTWGQAAGFLPPALTAARPSQVHGGSCQPVLTT